MYLVLDVLKFKRVRNKTNVFCLWPCSLDGIESKLEHIQSFFPLVKPDHKFASPCPPLTVTLKAPELTWVN